MKKIILFFLFLLIAVPHVYASPASLSFDPIELTVKKGETFKINVNMFSADQSVASSDIMINYDKILLEPVPDSIENGDVFNTIETKVIAPGKLYVYGIEENKNQAQSAQGTVAVVSFKALKTGIATLSFDCNQRNRNTSKIIKNDSQLEDIISCNATVSHVAEIAITDGTVLGTYTDIFSNIKGYTAILGALVAVFTFFVFIRYQRLRKDLT